MTEDTREVVAENVKRFREAKKVSVPDAADAVGVHRSWWNLLENGTLNFTIDKLERVASFLDVTVLDLITEDSDTVFAQSSLTKSKSRKRNRRELVGGKR